jgi:hypothetical protein
MLAIDDEDDDRESADDRADTSGGAWRIRRETEGEIRRRDTERHAGSAHISLQAQISRRQYGLPYEYLSPTFRRRNNYLRVKGNLERRKP